MLIIEQIAIYPAKLELNLQIWIDWPAHTTLLISISVLKEDDTVHALKDILVTLLMVLVHRVMNGVLNDMERKQHNARNAILIISMYW